MPRLVWLILTGILYFFATLGLMNSVYWIIIGSDVEHPGLVAGTFIFPLLLYCTAYLSWTKARATVKQREKRFC